MPSLSLSLNGHARVPTLEANESQKEPNPLIIPIDLNKPGFDKDLGSVTDPVGEIVDLGGF